MAGDDDLSATPRNPPTAGIERLAHHEIPGHEASTDAGADHPMRVVTRRVAGLEPGGWDDDLRRKVSELFDSLAPDWNTRDTPERRAVVADALSRGLGAVPLRHVGGRPTIGLEIGSGTGVFSAAVAAVVDVAAATDLASEMLRTAPLGPAQRVRADASTLPVRASTVDLVAAINMFLFPDEVARILRVGGVVVWVNVSGPRTPIHLSTTEVVESLPFDVSGVEATAGAGTWCVLRRQS